MQFTAGGHVLGFAPGKVYMVGMGYALSEEFVGARRVLPVPKPSAESGSLDGADETAAVASSFQGVCYPELWEGISLRYEKASGALAESVYIIQPGAEVKDIRIRYNTDFRIGNDGSLRFRHPTEKGYFTLSRPVAWQEMVGRKIPVEAAFQARGEKTLGFRVGARNPDIPLFIDPVYQWHSFYGSPGGDIGYGIAVAGDGVYVTGASTASWNVDGGTPPLHPHAGASDMVILKLGSDGAYQWHTFYGSPGADIGYGIVVAGDGVYETGASRANWNGNGGTPPLHPHTGDDLFDMVILKLDADGAYQWHTFYGGAGWDDGYDISVAGEGVYVTGQSLASWNGEGGAQPLHPHAGASDMVILKLDTEGAYQWHTFYGSADCDYGNGIAAVGDGAYVTGQSFTSWNGEGGAQPVHSYGGGPDIVVIKLGTDGAYQWHSFYGSADWDYGTGIAAVGDGAYVTGQSFVTWNGDGGAQPVHSHGGFQDIVVIKLGTDGAYQWHTFYGSEDWDYGLDIAAAGDGVYVTGRSHATWNGDGGSPPIYPYVGGPDISILKIDTEGAYKWHTFYGCTDGMGWGIATAGDGVYVAGEVSFSSPEEENPGIGPLHPHSGALDIAVLKISDISLVLYHPNGASAGEPPTDSGGPYAEGAVVTVLGNTGGLVQGGQVFLGWNTEADGSGTSYDPGDTFLMPATGVTLYAQYSQAIPTLSEWGVIVLSLLMAAAAVACMRRRERMVS
jgi:hypothetical protein